jgi:endo-1,4-beta-xylanase
VAHLRDLADFPIGVAVSNSDSSTYNILTVAAEQNVVERHFDQMTAGNIMKMDYLHPKNDGTPDDYDFTEADEFVTYAKLKGMSIHGHTMFWHSDYQVPEFMKNWTGTSEEFLTVVDEHVTTLVDHFETFGNVKSWDVVNEALTDDNPSNYRQSPFYKASGNTPDFIERAFKAAREANAEVELYYNDYSTENNGAKTDMMITMIDDLLAKDTPITGVGFQMHLYLDFPSIDNIKAAMKKVVDRSLKVKITELDVSINNPFSTGWSVSTAAPYDGFAQKKRYCEIVKAYIDTVPEALRGGVTVWGTTDANTWLNMFYKQQGKTNGEAVSWPLLFDAQYNDKPALRGFADALTGTACTNL